MTKMAIKAIKDEKHDLVLCMELCTVPPGPSPRSATVHELNSSRFANNQDPVEARLALTNTYVSRVVSVNHDSSNSGQCANM